LRELDQRPADARHMTFAGLRNDLLIVTCAISAGIHGALAPEHFAESTGAGAGFVVATVLLAALAVGLTLWPGNALGLAAAAVFAGLLVSYMLAVTTGLPVLHPDKEAVDGLALFTKAIEIVGLFAAGARLRPAFVITHLHVKGSLT
jgi:hypothetical protein